MKVQLEIDGKLREFIIEPSEDFELSEETIKEIETELLITEAKALSKQLKLNTPEEILGAHITPKIVEMTTEEIEAARMYFTE